VGHAIFEVGLNSRCNKAVTQGESDVQENLLQPIPSPVEENNGTSKTLEVESSRSI